MNFSGVMDYQGKSECICHWCGSQAPATACLWKSSVCFCLHCTLSGPIGTERFQGRGLPQETASGLDTAPIDQTPPQSLWSCKFGVWSPRKYLPDKFLGYLAMGAGPQTLRATILRKNIYNFRSGGCFSVVRYLPCMCEVWGSIPGMAHPSPLPKPSKTWMCL